jgi:hypothetical protein
MWSAAASVTPAPWNLCSRREAPRAAQGNVPSGTAGCASQDIGVPFRCDTGCVAVAKISIRRDFRPHAAAKRSGDAGAPQSPAPAAFDLNGETKMARTNRRSPIVRSAYAIRSQRNEVLDTPPQSGGIFGTDRSCSARGIGVMCFVRMRGTTTAQEPICR